MKEFILKILKSVIRGILGRYSPQWAAALEAGQAAYVAEDHKEQDAAVAAEAAKIQQIQAGVETRKEEAHAQVTSAADPGAAVKQQLRQIIAADQAGDDS